MIVPSSVLEPEPQIQPQSDSLYVMGGQQRYLRSLNAGNRDWSGYHKGVILRVDPATGRSETCFEYVSPAEVCVTDTPEIMLQSGTVNDGKLFACTGTEVIVYALPDFRQIGYISLPCFNDIHHVCPMLDGTLLVANAGLDMVLQLTTEGEIVRIWNVLNEDPWERFSPDTDYRRVGSMKPHRSHPNYIFRIEDDIWATRFQQGDAVCLTQSKRIQVSAERIHDGVVYGDHVYFTSVNGTVVIVSTRTLQIEEVIDLTTMHPEGTLLGWCRGILLEEGRMWVGYSRIRPTKARENVAWLMRGFKQVLGTRVACYDIGARSCIYDIDLEPAGMNAVFGIFRCPESS